MSIHLAIDLGASSGRHIIGWMEEGELKTRELYRFKNSPIFEDGHWVWEIDHIAEEVLTGLKLCFDAYPTIDTLAIDSWGVDSVRIKEGQRRGPCFCYRDGRTSEIIEAVHQLVSFEELYARTGIQFQAFNSIYQWMDDLKHHRLEDLDALLMIPEYINYKLTGNIRHEHTNATTTSLVNLLTQQYDRELIHRLGLPDELFPSLHQAGSIVGELLPTIQKRVGGNTQVMLCASHDTGSAFESIDLDEHSVLLSSGTWSLMGIKQKDPIINDDARSMNFTHEGGIQSLRILKNIMGLWIINQIRAEYPNDVLTDDLLNQSKYAHHFDVNDPYFIKPDSMTHAIQTWFTEHEKDVPQTPADVLICAYQSLVRSYHSTLKELEAITGRSFNRLVIIGGGAKDERLNQLTRQVLDIEVITYPIEATAIGNLKVQMQKGGKI